MSRQSVIIFFACIDLDQKSSFLDVYEISGNI